jgi:hypothetical protein
MTTIAKFHYLRSSVIGDAAFILDRFDVSPDSYNDAWQMLLKEYDNKRALIRIYLQSFIYLSKGKFETAVELKKLRDTVRRARNKAGMPSQLLGLYRSIYYDRETWLRNTSKMEY